MIRRLIWVLAVCWSVPAFAWGAQGHREVAAIDEANISPRTAAAIADLLRHEGDLQTPRCRVQSLSDASVWPDCLRGDPGRWQETFAWHYQDGPICAADFDPAANCPDGACVTAQIVRQRGILADRSQPKGQRLIALAFLAHFIGDVHQPFHAADDGDKGGNAETVTNAPPEVGYYGTARPISLHWFWDDTLVKRALAGRSLARPFTPAERARIATGNPNDWARESWQIAVKVAYPQVLHGLPCGSPPPANVTISDADSARDMPIVRGRLTQAGLRLARVLDQALGG